MNLITAFYYNLESSTLYIQKKIWGRFFSEQTGLRILNLSVGITLILWIYLSSNQFHINLTVALALTLLPIASWIYYVFSKKSGKYSAEQKIRDFTVLTPVSRWLYLIYAVTFNIIAPLFIVAVILFALFK